MKLKEPEIKNKLIQRLKRAEGQIHGVQVMLAEERDCREIMQQLAAVHSAIQSTSRLFFRDYAAVCMAELDEEPDKTPAKARREQMVQEMIALLDKTP
jgi:CsoR family transcriptional regulator, copper-sensing transcriptional repressor